MDDFENWFLYDRVRSLYDDKLIIQKHRQSVEQARASALKEHACSTWCDKHDKETEYCKECEAEIRADERAKCKAEYGFSFAVPVEQVDEKMKEAYAKGQADLIEKLRLDIGRMKKSLLEDMAYTGGKGGKNYVEQMGKYFDGYNRAIDDIIKYRQASESLGANALSLVSGGKRVITTPKPEKPMELQFTPSGSIIRKPRR